MKKDHGHIYCRACSSRLDKKRRNLYCKIYADHLIEYFHYCETDNEVTTGDWVCYKCIRRAETAAKLTNGT